MRSLSALALAITLAFTAPALANPVIGAAAPDFTATTASGKTLSLADLKGKIVVLEWTNADCPFVRKHYGPGNMQALQKELTAKGVVWLQVISSAEGKQGYVDADGANKLNTERGAAPSEVLLDASGVIGRAYLAKTTPHMYVIDATGKLAYMGAIDDDYSTSPEKTKTAKNLVREAVSALQAGKPVETVSTRSYGCAIKYGDGE